MKHLIFIFADHFEPRTPEQLEGWLQGYPKMACEFSDADGFNPRHTWFYDGEDDRTLATLSKLCAMRLGEIEVHLHHSRDTAEGLLEKLERRKDLYSRFGALVTSGPSPERTFGFVHGKWSLDNSRGDEYCGVNNELSVLRQAGCYADFTFPAWGRMQPARRNSIYYAKDDPEKPKSYDDGVEVEVGKPACGDLMIVQGPGSLSGLPRSAGRIPGLARLVDRLWLTCGLAAHLPPWPSRVDRWVRSGARVRGRPEWVFVKVHAHGARNEDFDVCFGEWARRLHAHLAARYNDGHTWRLHYATAREAYNIIKAAEAGMAGDPGAYRDFLILPYQNTR